ncbi:hypothetical protein ACFFK0_10495 [Paenibacillus chartarius]|uniref:Uncharacterized protein n=1 Tax=Paenibacillus chartarius TaxID=747481 RepID=A0ABV6DJR0_9BACL
MSKEKHTQEWVMGLLILVIRINIIRVGDSQFVNHQLEGVNRIAAEVEDDAVVNKDSVSYIERFQKNVSAVVDMCDLFIRFVAARSQGILSPLNINIGKAGKEIFEGVQSTGVGARLGRLHCPTRRE